MSILREFHADGNELCFFDKTCHGSGVYACGDKLDERDLYDILVWLSDYPNVQFTLIHLAFDLMTVNAYEILNGRVVSFKELGHFDYYAANAESTQQRFYSTLANVAIGAYLPEDSIRIDSEHNVNRFGLLR